MIKRLKKLILVLLSVVLLSTTLLSPVAHAQLSNIRGSDKGTWWNPKYDDFLDKVNLAPANEIFGERYTHAQVAWILNSLISMLVGPVAACSGKPEPAECIITHFTASSDMGVGMPLALLIDQMLHTKPASSIDYVASRLERLGIVDNAYAQEGFGFSNSLTVAQPIWLISRNAAYSLVILMILILGFMIMFRAQVSSRASVTVQSALPRVFVGLILITFSYAIGGLIVDLTFVAQGLLAGIVTSASAGAVSITGETTAVQAFNNLNNVMGTTFSLFFALILVFFGVILTGLVGVALAGPFSLVAGVIFILIFVFAIIVALVRIFWVMLKTYATVVILVALSPFIFLYGIVKDGINMMWFRMMIANMSVFFSVGALILMANILIFTTASPSLVTLVEDLIKALPGGAGGILNPNPYDVQQIGGLNQSAIMPGFTSLGNTETLAGLVALALFISTPKFANSIKDWISKGSGDFRADGMNAALGGQAGRFTGGISGVKQSLDAPDAARRAAEASAAQRRLRAGGGFEAKTDRATLRNQALRKTLTGRG